MFLQTAKTSVLFLALFLFGIGVVKTVGYNQNMSLVENAEAQEVEVTTVCRGGEIAVGSLMEQGNRFQNEILRDLTTIAEKAFAQRREAKALIELADEFRAENCTSSCQLVPVPCGKDCVTYVCVTSACTGTAGPIEKVNTQMKKIASYSKDITGIRGAMYGLLNDSVASPFDPDDKTKRSAPNHLRFTLEKSRQELRSCVTPSNAYEEEVQRFDALYSCQAGKFFGILDDEQQQCQINNFFCCSIETQ